MKKQLTVAALCVAMVLSSASAYADPQATTGVVEDIVAPTSVGMNAIIKEIKTVDGKTSILVKNTEKDSIEEVLLHISEETIILDNATGLPGSINELKVDQKIFVHHSAAMTMSLPPQTQCFAILTNLEENKAIGKLIEVNKILEKTEEQVKVLTNDKQFILTFLKENSIVPYRTKQIESIQNIEAGSKMMVWFDVMALSMPAQATVDRAVVLPREVNPVTAVDRLKINGKDIDLGDKKVLVEKDQVMVPVRLVAETLGFQVGWDTATQSITLDNGTVKTSLTVGVDRYYKASSQAIGLTAPFQYGVAPMVVEETTYVPVEMFNLLFSNDVVSIDGNQVVINTESK